MDVVATPLGTGVPNVFSLKQGQHILLTLFVAAFATLYSEATIYLFFVLPVKARWFLWLEVLFAFLAFLGSKDLAGFLGICTGVFATWFWLQPKGRRPGLRELWLRTQRWWLERRMKQLRRKRGFKVVPGEGQGRPPGDPGPNGYFN